MATVWDAIAARNPLAMYRHDEASGLVMVDSSGNGRNGTIDAGVQVGQTSIMAGAPGTSWLLNAVEGGSVTGASWMAPASAFTALVFFNASSLAGGQMTAMARSNINAANSNSSKAWAVSILANGTVTGRVFENLGANVSLTSAAGAVTTGGLVMLTVSHDGTTARFRKNGSSLIASGALSGPPVSFGTNTQPLTFGRDATLGITAFNGKMQGGAFFGTALTDADLDAIWTAANTTPISQGTGAGTWTFTGAATGKRTPKATGAGTWTFVGAAVGSAPSVASDPNPITLTIRDTGHRATVRETGHTTTVRSPSARATIREQH